MKFLMTLSLILSLNSFAQENSELQRIHHELETAVEDGILRKSTSDKHVEILAHDEDGNPELAKVTRSDGSSQVVGMGFNRADARRNFAKYLEEVPGSELSDAELKYNFMNNKVTLRLNLGMRAKFPDLIGLRVGMQISDWVEFGFDMGSSVFVTHMGPYVNIHPMGHLDNGWRGLYVSGRFYNSYYFAILTVAQVYSGEVVVGYKFDKKPGGWYTYLEAGVNVSSTDTRTVAGWTASLDKPIILPIVAFGFGYQFDLRKKQ